MNDFGFYFQLGWEHIMSWDALDHILFVFVLAASHLLKDWRQVLILITAFTIGHSITLALSTFQVIEVASDWVEFLIPCTIVFTVIANLFFKNRTTQSGRLNYGLALFFGLIHGLGFANTLRFMLAQDGNFGWSLFGFNVGLEVGQLVVVTLILLLATLLVAILKLPRRIWIVAVSVIAGSLAAKMALERLP